MKKKSLHRILILRIVLVTVVVSAIVSAVVYRKEQTRIFKVAQDRALIRTGTLNVLIRDALDAPGPIDQESVKRGLKTIAYKGFNLSYGHYVFARILDRTGAEVARLEDRDFRELASIRQHIESAESRLPAQKTEPEFVQLRLGNRDFVHALVPLSNSKGETAASVEAYFATSPEGEKTERRNILTAIALAIGIVLTTSLLLYPFITRLMRQLERLSLDLLDANLAMVGVVGSTIAKRDSDTDAHNFRVTIYAVRVAEALGLDEQRIRILIKGAFLHDVGKIGIRDKILLKPGKLDEEEFEEMKKHVNHGLDIVFKSTWLKEAAQVVGSHHEKYEGNGYPDGLIGEDIPVLARIFAIADVFDALTSHRPYKQPLSYEETVEILMKGRSSHFDPVILDVFVTISRPLYDKYGSGDDDTAHRDLKSIVDRYYSADIATFFE